MDRVEIIQQKWFSGKCSELQRCDQHLFGYKSITCGKNGATMYRSGRRNCFSWSRRDAFEVKGKKLVKGFIGILLFRDREYLAEQIVQGKIELPLRKKVQPWASSLDRWE
ncbi:MAG: hypothetical protein GYA86_04715 [Firmicutes bacterium]|nr:hypothetical protein [Bacillota bacterium]